MIPIIDFRCRPPFKAFTNDWIFNMEDCPDSPGLKSKYLSMGMAIPASLCKKSMDEFFKENERCGIVHSVVPLRVLPGLDNDDLVQLLNEWPDRFTGFAGIQPSVEGIEKSLKNITDYALTGSCAGIYMEPGLDKNPWHVDDEKYFPIFELCEKNDIPVTLLFGGVFHKASPPLYSIYSPDRVEHLATAFPKLRILLSHACWPFTAHACAVALNWENIWLSPDGFMIDHPGSQDYVVAANYRLQDKIIFGSLYPSVPIEYSVSKYRELLRPEVHEKIFCRNALAFLRHKAPRVNLSAQPESGADAA